MKRYCFIFLIGIMLITGCFSSYAAGLVQNADSVQFENADGSLLRDTWKKIDGFEYYFDTDGNMLKDTIFEFDGDRYYLDKDGKKVRNAWTKIKDDDSLDEHWLFFSKNGKAKESGWLTWNGEKYHFTDFYMDYGWYIDENGKEYFLNGSDDGHMETGWLPYTESEELDPENRHITGWYYFLPTSGVMVKDKEKKIVSKYYAFNETGLMIDGFGYVRNSNPISLADLFIVKYFDIFTGERADGWRYVENADDVEATIPREDGWYYMKNGEPYTAYNKTQIISPTCGIAKINGDYYAFDNNGKMVKGLVIAETDDEYDGHYYCFGNDGKMLTGYVYVADIESDITAPADNMFFKPKGALLGRGASVTGVSGRYLYENGVRVVAEIDRYELYEHSTGKTYVISDTGVIVKHGVVILNNGRKMKIVFDGEDYDWVQVN